MEESKSAGRIIITANPAQAKQASRIRTGARIEGRDRRYKFAAWQTQKFYDKMTISIQDESPYRVESGNCQK